MPSSTKSIKTKVRMSLAAANTYGMVGTEIGLVRCSTTDVEGASSGYSVNGTFLQVGVNGAFFCSTEAVV